MAWLAVDKNGTECVCSTEPYRDWVDFMWCIENISTCTVENPHIINSIYFRSIIKENDFNGKDQDRIYSNNYHSRW